MIHNLFAKIIPNDSFPNFLRRITTECWQLARRKSRKAQQCQLGKDFAEYVEMFQINKKPPWAVRTR